MNSGKWAAIIALLLVFSSSGCGSSGGGSGKVLEGNLVEGVGGVERIIASVKHGVDEPIGDVEICALGVCSGTDAKGDFGFALPGDFDGGDFLITFRGHNIDSSVVATFPKEVKVLTLALERVSNTEIEIHEQFLDGK